MLGEWVAGFDPEDDGCTNLVCALVRAQAGVPVPLEV